MIQGSRPRTPEQTPALPAELAGRAAQAAASGWPRVLHVCSEVFPLLKTGGLADVTAALPPALRALGCDARLLLPGFPAIWEGLDALQRVAELPRGFGADGARLWRGQLPDGTVCYLIDSPQHYQRPGNPYNDEHQQPWPDNHLRFALLGAMARHLANGADARWRPQVLHCHDWHAGLAPAYLRAHELGGGKKLAGTIMTVHNLAYQGLFARPLFGELGLPAQFNDMQGLEFYQQLSYLKAGLYFADKITTVSPTYAREILGSEQGCGLDGLLRQRGQDLSGILNGVDPAVWHPRTDSLVAARYHAADLAGKVQCRQALQQQCGLSQSGSAPLIGVVSRLTEQKGLHLLLAGLPGILARGGQVVVLGTGEPALEQALAAAAASEPQSVAVHLGFDEAMAHRIIAGADVIGVPSRFEPCGLTQLYGLQYGSLPLVHRVGGLADTVTDCSLENLDDLSATGFVFTEFTQPAFDCAVRRAFALYKRPAEWQAVQQQAMHQDVGWQRAAGVYLALYRQVAVPA